jgi:hypothetical protein
VSNITKKRNEICFFIGDQEYRRDEEEKNLLTLKLSDAQVLDLLDDLCYPIEDCEISMRGCCGAGDEMYKKCHKLKLREALRELGVEEPDGWQHYVIRYEEIFEKRLEE